MSLQINILYSTFYSRLTYVEVQTRVGVIQILLILNLFISSCLFVPFKYTGTLVFFSIKLNFYPSSFHIKTNKKNDGNYQNKNKF